MCCRLCLHVFVCWCWLLQWCIKARVTRKGLMRSIGRGGGAQTNIFSVELVDAQVGGEQG